MDRHMEQIALAYVVECERQGVGLDRLACLLAGYAYAADHAERPPTEGDVLQIAGIIEPTSRGRYPDPPVTFASGARGAEPSTITGAVARIFGMLDATVDPDEFVEPCLVIHPFTDGNSRVAFVLRNWLAHTLDNPSPLPTYSSRLIPQGQYPYRPRRRQTSGRIRGHCDVGRPRELLPGAALRLPTRAGQGPAQPVP